MSSWRIFKYNYKILLIDVIYETNKYKIFLFIISRTMSLNTSCYITFAFISKKIFEIYKLLFDYVKDFYKYLNILDPNIILIDAQNNFIWTIMIIHLLAFYLLYLWHINKNIFVYYKMWFGNKVWKEFLSIQYQVLYILTKEIFKKFVNYIS